MRRKQINVPVNASSLQPPAFLATGLGANSPARKAVTVVNTVSLVSGFVPAEVTGTKRLMPITSIASNTSDANAQIVMSYTLLLVA